MSGGWLSQAKNDFRFCPKGRLDGLGAAGPGLQNKGQSQAAEKPY